MNQDNTNDKLTLARIFSKWYMWGAIGIAVAGLMDFSSGAGFVIGIICWWLFQKTHNNNGHNNVSKH